MTTLSVVMRPGVRHAVILRRGPTRTTATYGWDLDTDAIVDGQWVRARLFPQCCDLSSDGAHWYYVAYDGRAAAVTDDRYGALARAPYVKAVKLWSFRRPVGGLRVFNGAGHLREATMRTRLVRDGWQVVDGAPGALRVRKPIDGGGAVERICHGPRTGSDRATFADSHALVDRHGDVREVAWDRADTRAGRVLWSEGAALHRATGIGLRGARVVRDFTDATFVRREAPY